MAVCSVDMDAGRFFPLSFQQLLQSVGMGLMVGLLFDLLTGCGRCARRRWVVFVLDATFGLVSAIVTFFGALVITDGILHPLLFLGVLLGFFSEHMVVGKWLSKGMAWLGRLSLRFGRMTAGFAYKCGNWLKNNRMKLRKSKKLKKIK